MATARNPDRVVRALVVALFVQGIGASAVLPMLPLFLQQRHASATMIGAVMASYFVAGVLTQYGAGHATDRLGHRRVLLAGLAVYAAASLGFLAPIGAGGYLALRGLQGFGAGAVMVAGLALVGAIVPIERRGHAFSRIFAAQLGGMAVGPLVGAAAGVRHMSWLFIITSAAAVLATLPVLVALPTVGATGRLAALPKLRLTRPLIGVLLVGIAGGTVAGVYETCWSLLMTSKGAAVWQIGLSWTLFALPFAAVSPLAGRLVDRHDRRWLAIWALLSTAAFAVAYPFLPSPVWLMALGSLESVGVAIAFPAAQSLLSQTADVAALGRAQGLFTTAETAAIGVVAAVSGYLFSLAHWLPFVAAAAASVAMVAALPVLWRGLPGHASAVPQHTDGLLVGAVGATH